MPSCLLSQSHNFFCLVSGHFCCKGVKYWTPLNSGIHGSGHNLAAQSIWHGKNLKYLHTQDSKKDDRWDLCSFLTLTKETPNNKDPRDLQASAQHWTLLARPAWCYPNLTAFRVRVLQLPLCTFWPKWGGLPCLIRPSWPKDAQCSCKDYRLMCIAVFSLQL